MAVLSRLFRLVEPPFMSAWLNDDIRPLEVKRRTWTFLTFHNHWLLVNCGVADYLTGSALIPLGLLWWQAILAVVVADLIATCFLILSSLQGTDYHIGFSAYNRSVWGLWGAQLPIWNRIFLCLIWYGFQSWVGGQCLEVMLLSWDPDYERHIPNTIPAGTGMNSAQFVAYIVFCIISLPFLWIRPHRLEKFFAFASSITIVFFITLLIWALATMGHRGFEHFHTHSHSGQTSPQPGAPNSVAWLFVFGVMSRVGAVAAPILNQSDYARLAKRPIYATWGQALAFPLYGVTTPVFGILTVAATQKRFGGEAIWSPPALLMRILETNPSPGTRAAIFFAGLALCVSQIGGSVPGHALAGGIDLAGVFPRYINLRRGAFITAILSPVVNPWRLVSTATAFLAVLSGFGVFLAPMTGIMIGHYSFVSRRKIKTQDLYRGNSRSIYWYTWGINWRAPVAWVFGFAPCLPGFISSINPSLKAPSGGIELYYLNYLYGALSSCIVLAVLHRLFPAKRVDEFVDSPLTAREVREASEQQWDVDYAQCGGVVKMYSVSSRSAGDT